jgi:hypothetical protein
MEGTSLMDLSDRDLAALRFIGEGYEVAQYQLHEAIFRERAATVVSRFVVRAEEQKLIVPLRQNRIGINRLRLTARARTLLVDRSVAHVDEIFVPRVAVSAKDLAHTLWINDLRVAANQLMPRPDLALPAWALQRRLQPAPPAIPDLLAVWKATTTRCGLAIGCEVDLGGEGLKVFIPKLARLFELIERWSAPSVGLVLVLCRGKQRQDSIRREMEYQTTNTSHLALEVEALPEQPGRESIAWLTALLHEATRPLFRLED